MLGKSLSMKTLSKTIGKRVKILVVLAGFRRENPFSGRRLGLVLIRPFNAHETPSLVVPETIINSQKNQKEKTE